MEELYNQEGVDALSNTSRPIPGQSLTSSPDEPRSFESAPQFTEFKEALDFTVAELLKEENLIPLLKAVDEGMPVTDIVMQMGYVGFREGKWNPDLMMMLIEPFMYLLMALAEKAGIEYRIDDEDDDDDEDSLLEEKVKNISETLRAKEKGKIPAGGLPSDILQDIEALEMPKESLLEKPQEAVMEEEKVEAQQSLLGRGE